MSEFRRKQQEERKRLDKAKTKWHSEQVRGGAMEGVRLQPGNWFLQRPPGFGALWLCRHGQELLVRLL